MIDQWVVPIYESERGWGGKIDGYAGPFDSFDAAAKWRKKYNDKYNNKPTVPDWYMAAIDPEVYRGQKCVYRTDKV